MGCSKQEDILLFLMLIVIICLVDTCQWLVEKKIDDIFHKSTMMLNVIIEKVFYILCLNGPWYYNLVRIYFSNPHRLIKAKFWFLWCAPILWVEKTTGGGALISSIYLGCSSKKYFLSLLLKLMMDQKNNRRRCSYFFHLSWLFFQKVFFVSFVEIDDEMMISCWHDSYHFAFLGFYF
mgnify:CR=1 FL=1